MSKSGLGGQVLALDVRPLLAEGREPFGVIQDALASLPAGGTLRLQTPFLPSPLIGYLKGRGCSARPERSADGSWITWLTPGPGGFEAPESTGADPCGGGCGAAPH